MHIFIDSASLSDIKAAAASGLVDGVTTNPTLIAKAGQSRETIIHAITELIDGPISAEVLATDTAGMLSEGLALASIHRNIVVKLPMIPAAMPVVQTLNERHVRTNVTLVFSVAQAVLAAKAGATYISPFVGRLDDQGEPGMTIVANILQAYRHYHFSTQVLVASIRNREHVEVAAGLGAHAVTVPASVFTSLFEHPLTTAGLERFLNDAKANS